MAQLQFRGSRKDEIPQVLDFIEKNGFTKRSHGSWAGERMESALALEGKKIVGAFPFAVRKLKISKGSYARAGHASAVAVEEGLRGKGIGSEIILFFKKGGFPGLDCLVVNRIDDRGRDPAYRWYKRNGFRDMAEVRCLFASPENVADGGPKKDLCGETRAEETRIDDGNIEGIDYESLLGIFEKCFGEFGGFQERSPEFWKNRFRYHYYRERNEYWLLGLSDSKGIAAYAIIGKNSIRGQAKANVLEYAVDRERICIEELVREIASFCIKNNIPMIRFVVSDEAKAYRELLEAGFEDREGFKFMALELKQGILEKKAEWAFFDFDYI